MNSRIQGGRQGLQSTVTDVPVAHAILQILEAEGVEYIFGIPGGPLTSFFEALKQRGKIRFVLAKHEGAAAYMAAAYARVSGTLGVCCVTSGPGATNALTGIASAYAESLPVLLLTGQVATRFFGKGAIQESSSFGIDLVDLFRPVTLESAMLLESGSVPHTLRSVLRTALSGRCGPVHLSMPADLLDRLISYQELAPERYRAHSSSVDRNAIALAAKLLAEAERPCLLVGHGAALSRATDELLNLANNERIAVVTSPKGKGTFPEQHPRSLGVLGFGGHELAERYFADGDIDVLMVIGSSLNEFVTNGWSINIEPSQALIQIDVDPLVIGRNYPVDVAIVGDARTSLAALNAELACLASPRPRMEEPLAELRATTPRYLAAAALNDESTPLKPQRLVRELRQAMPDEVPLFVDNGTSIIWASHYFEARCAQTYFIDLGLAAMGSAVCGVIGGALATAGRRAVALVGDAAFAMHATEVHTAVELRLPVIWLVLNNGGHGMVHQGETLMKGQDLGTSLFRVAIDSASLARSLGAEGVRVESPAELRAALSKALAFDGPTVIDAMIDANELAPTLVRRAETLARFARQHSEPPLLAALGYVPLIGPAERRLRA